MWLLSTSAGWYGGSVGWENWLGLPDADMNYTRLLASARVGARKFLTFGRLWRRPEWSAAAAAPPMMNLHDYGYQQHASQHWNQSCPTAEVLAECWLADDGTFAVVATNHGGARVVLDVTVDVSSVGGAGPMLVRVTKTMAARSVAVLPVVAP